MISGLVPFYEIVSSVKDETGIENMRPLYERIRRLIFRGEREIGYGGSVVIKKALYRPTADFNGKYFAYPVDFIELEGVGQCGSRMCSSQFTCTSEGVRFRKNQTKDIVLLYWGIMCDGEGNPCTTRNHEEAIVAFIVWKLYTSKMFLGIGNMNANIEYKMEANRAILEARGDDAWPTMEEWTELGALTYADPRILLMYPSVGYSYSIDEDESCKPIDVEDLKINYWQLSNPIDDINDVILLLSDTYLDAKPFRYFKEFESGIFIDHTAVGRVCFAIRDVEDLNCSIIDVLGNDITHMFDSYCDPATKSKIYVSDEIRTYSTISYKFKNLENGL